jgi:two-component system cell cycle sensor histidine kinase/response regulator CckA
MGTPKKMLRSPYVTGHRNILSIKKPASLAATMLHSLGYQVDTVASSEEAAETIKIQPVNLLVLDMIMDPGIDGLETNERILDVRPGQKAIIVSGFSETDRIRKAQALGAGAYVRKPYVLEKIGLAVRRELDK